MHKDATGRHIYKGSYVVYAVTKGHSAGLKFGVVIALKERAYENSVYNSVTGTYNKVPATEYKIQIVSAAMNTYGPDKGKWYVQGKEEGKLGRPQTLDRLDRVIVLDDFQMHPEAKEALDREMTERGS